MKKVYAFLVMVLVFGIVGVFAADQGVGVEVLETVDFTLDTMTLNYGPVASGVQSNPETTQVTLGVNNNVDLLLKIELAESSNSLFENIFYDLDGDFVYESQLLKNTSVSTGLIDDSVVDSIQFSFMSVIIIPAGTPASTGNTGTVVFTATANPPA